MGISKNQNAMVKINNIPANNSNVKRSYEIVFIAEQRIIRDAENIHDAMSIANQICPKGFKVKEATPIKSREHYRSVKKEISNQYDLPILIS
jgi:hypothetical protein